MKKILIVCPNQRDYRELKKFQKKHTQILFHPYSKADFISTIKNNKPNTIAELVSTILKENDHEHFDAVASTSDYPGTLLASIIANKLNLPGPNLQSIISCEHKYYSRMLQQRIVPEATPSFALIPYDAKQAPSLDYPFFVKPIKSSFSQYANKVENIKSLGKTLKQSVPPPMFFQAFKEIITNYSNLNTYHGYLLGETLLTGQQATLDGFVLNGKVHILGIIDSTMHPETICFKEFSYPSHLPATIQARMMRVTKKIIATLKLDMTLFNVEFMYNPSKGSIHIIEINPRMSAQFADLYEKVDNINSYDILIDILTGRKPKTKRKETQYALASSFPLRLFEDKYVTKIPSDNDIAAIQEQYPDARIEVLAQEDAKLSDIRQDGKSFCYCIINIGAKDRKELEEKRESIIKQLPFSFT